MLHGRMRIFIFVLLFGLIAVPALAQRASITPLNAPAASADTSATDNSQLIERIVAVVNDDVITGHELADRVNLAFFSANLENNAENRQRLVPQVMRSMIDEQLQRQEAKRDGQTVETKEIDRAIAGLASDNKLDPAQLKGFLASHSVNIATLRDQVEANLLWTKVVQRKLRPLVEIGDGEIDQRLAQIAANAGKPEYLVAEIFLRVDNQSDDERVLGFAQQLVQQVKGGGNFAPLAQQFSQGAGAMSGGDLGWIQAGQLGSDLDRALTSLNKGQISDPVRTAAGYHILLVRDERVAAGADPAQVNIKLAQISLPRADGESDGDLAARADKARNAVKVGPDACKSLPADVTAQVPTAQVSMLDEGTLSSMPNWLGALAQSLGEGQVSDPLSVPGGAAMIVVCQRSQPAGNMPSRDDVLNQIGTERLELQARRLLRDLRREATVDIRL